MFRPNLTCDVSYLGEADGYGKRLYTEWCTARFGVVKMTTGVEKTSVRTDSSATRGSASEVMSDARFLFPAAVVLKPGDRIRFGCNTFTVVSVFPRHAVTGRFDHWQVDCNIYWGD